ncbi:714_t:CDS:2, partial [Funneliformis caledonium]
PFILPESFTMVSNSRRKKKKGSDIVEIPDKSSTSPLYILFIIKLQTRKVLSNIKKQKDIIKSSTSRGPSIILASKNQHMNAEHQNIPQNLLIPYIQIPVDKVNKLNDLTVNTRKN